MSEPKVLTSYKADCPNRFDLQQHEEGCKTQNAAVVIVYDDGTIEIKCPYCGLVKKVK